MERHLKFNTQFIWEETPAIIQLIEYLGQEFRKGEFQMPKTNMHDPKGGKFVIVDRTYSYIENGTLPNTHFLRIVEQSDYFGEGLTETVLMVHENGLILKSEKLNERVDADYLRRSKRLIKIISDH